MKIRRLTALASSALLVGALAACSSGGNTTEEIVEEGVDVQSAEQSEEVGAAGAGEVCEVVPDGEFPVEIHHALGTTVIEEAPERVATVAWSNHEVPLALGVVPVGMTAVSWGDDNDNGVMPWAEDRLEELGADTPVLFDETDGIDFEAVAATDPDVILAAYSGLTAEEYATLSRIAPTVAYPDVAWGTSLWDMICLNSKAIGASTSGAELSEDLQAQVQAALADNPELKDKKIIFAFIDPADTSQIGFYTLHDTRPGFLSEAGLPQPSLVLEATENTSDFYTTISAEQADKLDDVDVIVTYGDPGAGTVELFQSDPLLSQIPAVEKGNIVVLENDTPLAASANPSPLSIPWGISDYFALLNSTPAAGN